MLDPKTLYSHYLAGRHPDVVRMDPTAGCRGASPTEPAEVCAARALGAYHREQRPEQLPGVADVAAVVANLLDAAVAVVSVDGQPLPAGVRLELWTEGHFPNLMVTDPSGAHASVDLYVAEDRMPRCWQWVVDPMTTGKAKEALPAAPEQYPPAVPTIEPAAAPPLWEVIWQPGPDGKPEPRKFGAVTPEHVRHTAAGQIEIRTGDIWTAAPLGIKFVFRPEAAAVEA